MSQPIIYTITDKFDYTDTPKVSNTILTEKGIYVVLSVSIFKKIKGRNPGPVETQRLWSELVSDNNLRFDRTLIRDSIRIAFNDCLKNKFIVDFIYLSELCNLIKDKKNFDDLKSDIMNNQNKLNILLNIKEKPTYCYVIDEIKHSIEYFLSSKKINIDKNKNIFTIDEYIKLEELLTLDFDLLTNFVKYCNFDISSYSLPPINIQNIIEESEITIQQDIKIIDIINNDFIILNLKEDFNENTIILNNDLSLDNLKKLNNSIIIGESGSGKSIIGLKLCNIALQKGYNSKFINLSKYTNNYDISQLNNDIKDFKKNRDNKKFFFYLDGLEKIDYIKVKKVFMEFIFDLNETNEDIIILSSEDTSQEYKSILNKSFLSNYKRYYIQAINNVEKLWIKTPLEQTIYNEIKDKVKNRGALYYNYIEKVINILINSILDENLNLYDLRKNLQKIAFYSITKNIRLDELKKYNINPAIESILRKNKLIKIDEHNFGTLIFNNKIFRDFLISGYLISLSKEDLDEFINKENLIAYKWKYVMLFMFDWLNENIDNIPKTMIISILFHLRQQKEFYKVDSLLKLISDDSLKKEQIYEFLIEKATSFYYNGEYYKCFENSLKILPIDSKSKYIPILYNLLSSCTNDCHLPDISLKLNNIALIYADDNQKARCFGNRARAYLKKGDIKNAYKYFNLKKSLNETINKNESIRDESDLIFIECLIYNKSNSLTNISDLFIRSKKLIHEYNIKEKDLDIDESGNKAYIYRNLSYLLPKISNINECNDIYNFINEIKTLLVKDPGPHGVCLFNIGKFLIKKRMFDNSITYFTDALKYFEIGNYNTEIYQTNINLYKITNNKHYYDKALETYNNIKNESFKIIDEINNNNNIINLFDTTISYKDFILPKLSIEDIFNNLDENLNIF
ncbi:MAG: hypothetical protein U0354_14865 [Candidatus Sericytochromatia bacterium]